MTNIEMIEFIDEFLSEQEDVLHGIEGKNCTKSRKYLDMIKKQLTLTDVVNCNCDESKQLEEEFEISHLINDTYQVVGKDSNTVWKLSLIHI